MRSAGNNRGQELWAEHDLVRPVKQEEKQSNRALVVTPKLKSLPIQIED